ncbi:hypothetical protein ACSBR2_020368 [Camellia fascicularis]
MVIVCLFLLKERERESLKFLMTLSYHSPALIIIIFQSKFNLNITTTPLLHSYFSTLSSHFSTPKSLLKMINCLQSFQLDLA